VDPKNNDSKEKKTILATFGLMLLSLGIASSIFISVSTHARAQENQQQPGLFEGLEREQSDEAVPGAQPADTGSGPAPLNATTTVEEGGGNATNATMMGAGNATNATMMGAGNATNANNEGGTTVGGNQTGGGPLDAITDPLQDIFGGGGGGQ
jgi:hypothetical protein